MTIEIKHSAQHSGVMAVLTSERLLADLENGSIKYASEEIGRSIVLAYRDVIVKQVKPEEVLGMVKDLVAQKLAARIDFKIKDEEPQGASGVAGKA